MDEEVSHLTPAAAPLLAESDERRIRAIRSRRWVLYPRAKQALDRLSRLLDHPRGTRMPSVAIYGDSGMGKTMIMKRFRDEHPPRFTQRIVLNTLRFLSNRLQISLVCFGVNEAREAISGDVQLARRFEQFTLSRWAANEQFEALVASILRNTPLRSPSVLTPKSLRRMLQITEGITANIFHMINSLAVEAVESGREQITNEAVENWEPEFDTEAAFA